MPSTPRAASTPAKRAPAASPAPTRNGKIEVLAESWEGKKLNAPSQIVVSATGHVYFTDPAFGEQSDRRELDFHGVYHIPPKGPMTLVAKSHRTSRAASPSSPGRTHSTSPMRTITTSAPAM